MTVDDGLQSVARTAELDHRDAEVDESLAVRETTRYKTVAEMAWVSGKQMQVVQAEKENFLDEVTPRHHALCLAVEILVSRQDCTPHLEE